MLIAKLTDCLERTPVIAAVQDAWWEQALASPAEVLFHLNANLLTVGERIEQAHRAGKLLLVHLDLAEGIGKDRAGTAFLAACRVDGIISTRGQIIRYAKELGLPTVQRFFALDSKGVGGMNELLEQSKPDLIEIMPGVIGKIIQRFSGGGIPVIAGGLIETKSEVTEALGHGALAVSTGKQELWYL